jgi:hypothetical protein
MAGFRAEEYAVVRATLDSLGAHDVKVLPARNEMLSGSVALALQQQEIDWSAPRPPAWIAGGTWGSQRTILFSGARGAALCVCAGCVCGCVLVRCLQHAAAATHACRRARPPPRMARARATAGTAANARDTPHATPRTTAGLSIKAQATLLELLEAQGLPHLCVTMALEEEAQRRLGDVLAEAVKVRVCVCADGWCGAMLLSPQ